MPKKQIRNKSKSRHRNKAAKTSRNQLGQFFVLSMFVIGSIAGGLQAYLQPSMPNVLAYATNVSHSGLLASTNQNRSASGLVQLTLHGSLNSAAQAKANDMVAKNYWSHTSPDGRQPWDFITAAGYSYSMAGENLAYGALTSESTVQAWMNSPGHRANILKPEFRHVGFGYANSADYQGQGQQTVIVAMYGTPYASAPTPAPVQPTEPAPPTAPVPAPAPAPAPVAQLAPPPTKPEQKTETKKPVAEDEKKSAESMALPTQAEKNGEKTIAPISQDEPITRVEIITGNYSGMAAGIVALLGVVATLSFLYRHSRAWHRRIIKGEQFIIHHPLVDAVAVMSVVVVVVLMQNVGHIL